MDLGYANEACLAHATASGGSSTCARLAQYRIPVGHLPVGPRHNNHSPRGEGSKSGLLLMGPGVEAARLSNKFSKISTKIKGKLQFPSK